MNFAGFLSSISASFPRRAKEQYQFYLFRETGELADEASRTYFTCPLAGIAPRRVVRCFVSRFVRTLVKGAACENEA